MIKSSISSIVSFSLLLTTGCVTQKPSYYRIGFDANYNQEIIPNSILTESIEDKRIEGYVKPWNIYHDHYTDFKIKILDKKGKIQGEYVCQKKGSRLNPLKSNQHYWLYVPNFPGKSIAEINNEDKLQIKLELP